MAEETIFSKIIRREIPAKIVYETDSVLAFEDVNPQAPVHILIIPKKAISQVAAMGHDDIHLFGELFFAAKSIAHERGLDEQGYRLVMNNGLAAGQTVLHAHLHLMGGREFSWPPG